MNGDFYTTGKLCELLHIGFGQLQKAIHRTGIEPAFHLNGTPYYDAQALEQIALVTRQAGTIGPAKQPEIQS